MWSFQIPCFAPAEKGSVADGDQQNTKRTSAKAPAVPMEPKEKAQKPAEEAPEQTHEEGNKDLADEVVAQELSNLDPEKANQLKTIITDFLRDHKTDIHGSSTTPTPSMTLTPKTSFENGPCIGSERTSFDIPTDTAVEGEAYWRMSSGDSNPWSVPAPSPPRSSLDGRPPLPGNHDDSNLYTPHFIETGRSYSAGSLTSVEYSSPWPMNPSVAQMQANPLPGVAVPMAAAAPLVNNPTLDQFAYSQGPGLVRCSSSISSRGSTTPTDSPNSLPGQPLGSPGAAGTPRNQLFKTELCRTFMETGKCRYGSKCQFAHGATELRPVKRHPKYKTKVCRNFAETGSCPYGSRCRFIHGDSLSDELETSLRIVVQGLTLKDNPEDGDDAQKRLPVFQMLDGPRNGRFVRRNSEADLGSKEGEW